MSIIVALAILAAAQDVAPTATDPLALAASGKLQCYEPDVAKRSCQSLASYNKRPDGTYDNKATVMLSPSPLLVMETVTIVDIDAGAVCGALRKQDIDDAVVWINGSKLAEADAAATRNQIVTSMAPLLDRRICTTYVPDGAQLLAKVTINGAPLPALDEKVIWVAPTDGYKLAP